MFEQYNDVVTVKELCQMLKIGRNTAYLLITEKKIESKKIGNQYRICKESVIKYIFNPKIFELQEGRERDKINSSAFGAESLCHFGKESK